MIEAPDESTQGPLNDGGDEESDESERGADDLAAAGIVCVTTFDADRDAQREGSHG